MNITLDKLKSAIDIDIYCRYIIPDEGFSSSCSSNEA